VDVSLTGIATLAQGGQGDFLVAGLERLNGTVESMIAEFSMAQPERIAPKLAEGWKLTGELVQQVKGSKLSEADKYNITFELEIKKAQFNNALAQALGLSVACGMAPEHEPDPRFAMFLGNPETTRVVIPGQKFGVKVHAVNHTSGADKLQEIKTKTTDGKDWGARSSGATGADLTKDKPVDARFDLVVPKDAPYTRPYFSRPDIEQSYYDISDKRYLNWPVSPY